MYEYKAKSVLHTGHHRESKRVEETFVFTPPVVLSETCLKGLRHEIEFKYCPYCNFPHGLSGNMWE